MKIAINGLSARMGGGAAYLSNLLEHLSRIDHDNEYVVFTSPERKDSLKLDEANFRIIAPGFPGRAVVRRAIWEQLILPALIKRCRIDILFSPGGISPVIAPGRCKRINMVQNMAPFCDELLASYPFSKRKMRFLILRKLYPLFVAGADANIFISMDSLKALRRAAKLDTEKSKVIYHGRNESLYKPVPRSTAASFVQQQYGIGGEFVLYVSNIARYKRQLEVVEAYHIIRERIAKVKRAASPFEVEQDSSLLEVEQASSLFGELGKLVLAGIMVEPSYYHEVLKLAGRLGIKDEVVYLGQVPQVHLPYLYSAASVFVFASICENCPNILIEAMACGAPIASSNLGPMPEICGNAALYFDPSDPTDMADRMWQVLTDEAIRQKLVRNALENVKRFSWDKTARGVLEMFAEAMA
jgi:glycosyltransferase involved in cell wall biosynthesis